MAAAVGLSLGGPLDKRRRPRPGLGGAVRSARADRTHRRRLPRLRPMHRTRPGKSWPCCTDHRRTTPGPSTRHRAARGSWRPRRPATVTQWSDTQWPPTGPRPTRRADEEMPHGPRAHTRRPSPSRAAKLHPWPSRRSRQRSYWSASVAQPARPRIARPPQNVLPTRERSPIVAAIPLLSCTGGMRWTLPVRRFLRVPQVR